MLTLLLTLALSAASPDAATAAPSANPENSKPAKPAKPRKVCEKIEITGSTVPKRVCRTVADPAKPRSEAARADTASQTGGTTN